MSGNGTVTTNGTTTIVGTGTRFTRLGPGDVINIQPAAGSPPGEARVIIAVVSAIQITVDRAPATAGANLTYTIGDMNLMPGTRYQRLTLDRPLGEDYQREPLAPLAVLELNDAVVQLAGGGISSADYFDSSDSLLLGDNRAQWSHVFPSADTEYTILGPPGLITPVPRANFPNGDPLAQWFVNKWFSAPAAVSVTPPNIPPNQCGIAGCGFVSYLYSAPVNHQMLLVGDSAAGGTRDAGQTFLVTLPANQRCSVLDRGGVEYEVANNTQPFPSLYGLNADTILQKTEVHEIAHQWDVDGGPASHCQRVGYDSTLPYPQQQTPPAGTLFCMMAVDFSLTMPAPWNSSVPIYQTVRQYGDGHTSFHMTQNGNTWDSEYLTIRRAVDPWQP